MPDGRRPGQAALGSLVSEDLLATPGAAVQAASQAADLDPAGRPLHRLDLAQALLLGGEPRRAKRIIEAVAAEPDGAALARTITALRLWAAQLDQNWYPGNTGAEQPGTIPYLDLTPSPGPDEVVFLEHVVTQGPPALLAVRALLAGAQRGGNQRLIELAAGAGVGQLIRLNEYVTGSSVSEESLWAVLAQADLRQRAGQGQVAAEYLARIRAAAGHLGLSAAVALTHLTEGDWLATPGSSPEALGLDLGPAQARAWPDPSAADLDQAATCFAEAERHVPRTEMPGLRMAVHLRWAALAWLRRDFTSQRLQLDSARLAAVDGGYIASTRLIDIHLLLCDIGQGRIGERLMDVGSGWGLPPRGPIVQTRHWAETDGSLSWAAGLGRLLQRAGDAWRAQGEDDRAGIAYLGALSLLEMHPAGLDWGLRFGIAELDNRRNLSARALTRLQRLLIDMPVITDFSRQRQEISSIALTLMGIVTAQRSRFRTPAAKHAARGLEQVQRQLRTLIAVAADCGISPGALGAFEQAKANYQEQETQGVDSPPADVHQAWQAELVRQLREGLAWTEVFVPVGLAEHARQQGRAAAADDFFQTALEVARSGAPELVPLVLINAGRDEEAKASLVEGAAGHLGNSYLLTLALRLGDPVMAAAALERTGHDPATSADWRIVLSGVRLAVAAGELGRALDLAARGIDRFEEFIARLLRDPDRTAACDNPDAASLYHLAASAAAQLAIQDPATRAERFTQAFELVERARSLAIGQFLGEERENQSDALATWRTAAASWSADADRLLAAIDGFPPRDISPLLARVDAAEEQLRTAEAEIDREVPGFLVRRSLPGPPLALGAIQRRLPAAAILLEYHLAEDELLTCAVTRDDVRVTRTAVRGWRLSALVSEYHRACAAGAEASAAAEELSALLLAPAHDLLHRHHRVMIIPFGALNLVPFHALPLDGDCLGAHHVVSYAPTASTAVPENVDQPLDLSRAAVVGDPAFDKGYQPGLRRLPGAWVESLVVAARLRAASLLVGTDATEERVRQLIPGEGLIHLAAHGYLDELAPNASSIVLAGQDELTVAEIIGLRTAAEMIVLSACDTGRGATSLGGDVVGLTRSLLAAGARRAVVSLWPVDDRSACVTMDAFYEQLTADIPPASALAKAQAMVRGLDRNSLEIKYAALCQQAGLVDRAAGGPLRRSLSPWPDDDLAFNNATVRSWAPFILIGA